MSLVLNPACTTGASPEIQSARGRLVKTGFTRGCTRARALQTPGPGLRPHARLLNCPDATDDTIGIYAEQMFMNEKNV